MNIYEKIVKESSFKEAVDTELGTRYKNEKGSVIEILSPTKDGDIQFGHITKDNKVGEVVKTTRQSFEQIVKDNGYKVLHESEYDDDLIIDLMNDFYLDEEFDNLEDQADYVFSRVIDNHYDATGEELDASNIDKIKQEYIEHQKSLKEGQDIQLQNVINKGRNAIVNAFKDIIAKNPDAELLDGGAIYYMNGNDGTEFDWEANGRTCEFFVFYKSTELGIGKVFITTSGDLEGYYFHDEGQGEPEEISLPAFQSSYDAQTFAGLLYVNADKQNKFDVKLDDISFDADEPEYIYRNAVETGEDYYDESENSILNDSEDVSIYKVDEEAMVDYFNKFGNGVDTLNALSDVSTYVDEVLGIYENRGKEGVKDFFMGNLKSPEAEAFLNILPNLKKKLNEACTEGKKLTESIERPETVGDLILSLEDIVSELSEFDEDTKLNVKTNTYHVSGTFLSIPGYGFIELDNLAEVLEVYDHDLSDDLDRAKEDVVILKNKGLSFEDVYDQLKDLYKLDTLEVAMDVY